MKKVGSPSVFKASKTTVMSDARKKMKAYRKKNKPITKTGATKFKAYTKF